VAFGGARAEARHPALACDIAQKGVEGSFAVRKSSQAVCPGVGYSGLDRRTHPGNLEAEAAGIRATGIGCFFDDPVHRVFGFSDLEFQSLYHFTIGGPVEGSRLTTLAPYAVSSR
jgi:hypothetical protein